MATKDQVQSVIRFLNVYPNKGIQKEVDAIVADITSDEYAALYAGIARAIDLGRGVKPSPKDDKAIVRFAAKASQTNRKSKKKR